jgi:hypothetical protein
VQENLEATQSSSYEEIANVLHEAGMDIEGSNDEWHQDVYYMVTCTAFCR